MLARLKRWAILSLGAVLVVLGVLGLFLPVLQGILLLALGLLVLSYEWPPAQRQLDRLRRRYPQAAARVDAAERRVKAWLTRRAGGDKESDAEVAADPPARPEPRRRGEGPQDKAAGNDARRGGA